VTEGKEAHLEGFEGGVRKGERGLIGKCVSVSVSASFGDRFNVGFVTVTTAMAIVAAGKRGGNRVGGEAWTGLARRVKGRDAMGRRDLWGGRWRCSRRC